MRRFHRYSGDDFQGECPTGTGRFVTVAAVADEIGGRLTKIFLRGSKGLRPVFGQDDKLQADPNFQDHLLFYEDFHGGRPGSGCVAPDGMDRAHRRPDPRRHHAPSLLNQPPLLDISQLGSVHFPLPSTRRLDSMGIRADPIQDQGWMSRFAAP